ncbi:MAG: tetratricopeptide repeat protein, partial [Candidatus Obscuribacterales bacterium]|nr:tetratricopeptide repeat protein [Candidatus Obscuribacterales bacterium]
MNKSTNRIALALLSLTVFLGSTNCGALAQDDLNLGIGDTPTKAETARPINIPVRSPSQNSGTPGVNATMSEVRHNAVREFDQFKAPSSEKGIGRVDQQNKEAEELFSKGMYQDALILWQKAYGDSIEMKYSEGQGIALTGMCRVYGSQGKFVKARYLGENAVEVLSAIQAQTLLGKARLALAQAYTGLDNHVWAAKQLDAALALIVGQADKEPLEAASVLRMSGGLLLQHRKLKEAIQFFQHSAKYSEAGGDLDAALWMRTRISAILTEVGFYVAAFEEAQKAVAISDRIKDSRARITALSSLGNTQYVLGEYRNARNTYEEAYQLAKKLDPKADMSKEGKAYLLMGFAFSLVATGDTELASRYLNQLVPYFEKEGKYYHHAESVNALGILSASNVDSYKALPLFAQARDLQVYIKPIQPGMQVMILRNLAAAEFRIGKYREAYTHLKSALPIFAKNEGKLEMQRLQTFVSLAEIALKIGEVENCEKYLTDAFSLGESLKDDASLWRAYTLRAHLELTRKEADKAQVSLKSALSHFRSPQAGYFPNVELLRFPSTRREFGLQLAALVASQRMAEHALLVAEQLKEEQFIATWVRKGAKVRPEDESVYLDLMKQRAHLHA